MSIRINKAMRELNIGMQTVIDYLRKFPELGTVLANPSFKLNDRQYELLVDKFLRGTEAYERVHKVQANVKTDIKVSSPKKMVSPKESNMPLIDSKAAPQVIIQGGEVCFSLKDIAAWLKVDLDELVEFVSSISEQFVPSSQLIPSYLYTKILEHYDERIKNGYQEPQQKNDIFKTKTEHTVSQNSDKVSVLGKIDLSSIDSSTRPRRKTKNEKGKENIK